MPIYTIGLGDVSSTLLLAGGALIGVEIVLFALEYLFDMLGESRKKEHEYNEQMAEIYEEEYGTESYEDWGY